MVARYQGGNNAGHTLVIGDETYKLRLVPSGILYPGTICVLGPGLRDRPRGADRGAGRARAARRRHLRPSHLGQRPPDHAVAPDHRRRLRAALGRLQIGTTRRGIGPAYADKASRVGIRVQDLLDEKILRLKIQTALSVKNELLRKVHHHRPLDKDVLTEAMLRHAERIRPYIADTSLLVNQAARRRPGGALRGRPGARCSTSTTAPIRSSPRPTRSPAAPAPASASGRRGSTRCWA